MMTRQTILGSVYTTAVCCGLIFVAYGVGRALAPATPMTLGMVEGEQSAVLFIDPRTHVYAVFHRHIASQQRQRGPYWSPVDNRSAWVRYDGDALYTLQVRGLDNAVRHETQFYSNPSPRDVSWSPDGTQIAYIAKTEDLRSILMVLNLETGASTVLAEADDWAIDLAWSPTGDLIAFSVGNRVMRVNPDGTDLRPVTAQRNRDPAWLRWSSDGAHLLYGAEVRDRGPCLLVITLATGEAAFPRCSPTLNGGYDWSPDGAQIVFTERDVRSTSTIHVMDADGSNLFTLTNNRGDDIRPHWSPDGRWIVFSSNRADETYRPYYVAAEGGRVRSATHLAGARCCAGWR